MLTSLLVLTSIFVINGEEEAMLSAVTVNSKYLQKQVIQKGPGKKESFKKKHLQDNDLPHFVLFFTAWSKYCQRVSSDWEALADTYNNMDRQLVIGGKL